jgi:hypothetical protein
VWGLWRKAFVFIDERRKAKHFAKTWTTLEHVNIFKRRCYLTFAPYFSANGHRSVLHLIHAQLIPLADKIKKREGAQPSVVVWP